MAYGPEDSPKYANDRKNERQVKLNVCRKCQEPFDLGHCNDANCPWCRACWDVARKSA